MDIRNTVKGDVTVIEITGKLDSLTAPRAQEAVMPLLEAGHVVLDASKLVYVSSAGLRMLLLTAKKLAAKGRKAVLAGMTPENQDVMKMTGFDHMFEFYPTLDEAVAAAGKSE